MSNPVERARAVMTKKPFLNQIGRADEEKINKNHDRNRSRPDYTGNNVYHII